MTTNSDDVHSDDQRRDDQRSDDAHSDVNHDGDLTNRLRRSAASNPTAPALSPELVTAASRRRAPRLVNHGRTARIASASLATVAAVAIGSLVVVNPFAPRAPLFTAAAAGSAPAAAGASESSALADEARIALWIDYTYVAGADLSTEGGSGGVYQLQRIGSPEQVLADVAERFGVSGEVGETEFFDPAWPSYVIGPDDGTAPYITVTWSGTGSWWYSNPAAYPEPVCEVVSYETENGTEEFEECTQPEIAAADSLAPGENEARAQAAEIFGSLGLDVEPGDVRVMADSWATTATANLTVDGVGTAIDYSVSWTPLGEIAWAYGHSIEVVNRGTFDTVSPTAAVDRLADWRWFGAAGPDYQGGMSILAAESGLARDAVGMSGAPDSSVSSPDDEPGGTEPGGTEPGGTEPGASDPGSTESGEPDTAEPGNPGTDPVDPVEPIDPGAGEEPLPVDPGLEPQPLPEPMPMPEPETATITLDEAEATLLLMWDSEGNAWLVPGFAMPHPDGWFNAVVSLIDGVIELPAPFEGEIMPFLDD